MRIAIVEDELYYIDQIKSFLAQYQKENDKKFEVTVFFDGEDILDNYKGTFDVIFMDIQMRFLDGMKTAEKIRQIDPEVMIIFVTSMPQYALKGYEVGAFDFIVKPISYHNFSKRLDRVIERSRKKESHYIMIPIEDGIQKLDIAKILYIESQGHSLLYHTQEEVYKGSGKLQDMEGRLKNFGFFQSNKGYLVNLDHVEGLRDGCSVVNGNLLPISRSRKTQFMEALMKHISEVAQ